MPAAAVIPAPVAYLKVVAVKKLVVGLLQINSFCLGFVVSGLRILLANLLFVVTLSTLHWVGRCWINSFTLRKIACSKQASFALNILAWDNTKDYASMLLVMDVK